LICTDGDSDFYDDRRGIRSEATALSSLPRIKLVVVGMNPENFAWWRELVGRPMGGRLTLIGRDDQGQGISTIVD
jgi:hypothetical protein